jgi:ABC-type uncharacterized transport system substrate-binding protein
MPVGQPINFQLAVNLQAAKALGVELNPEVVLRADVVVR